MDINKLSEDALKVKRDTAKVESKVGEAAYKLLQKTDAAPTVEEILNEYQTKYAKEIEETIQNNHHKFDKDFYILVLTKKEHWAVNVLRNWFIARQTPPSVSHLRREYPNFMSTLYKVNKNGFGITVEWSLPTEQDCKTILKNKHLYDPQLVSWIEKSALSSLIL